MVTVSRETRVADLRAVRMRPPLIREKRWEKKELHSLSAALFFLPTYSNSSYKTSFSAPWSWRCSEDQGLIISHRRSWGKSRKPLLIVRICSPWPERGPTLVHIKALPHNRVIQTRAPTRLWWTSQKTLRVVSYWVEIEDGSGLWKIGFWRMITG